SVGRLISSLMLRTCAFLLASLVVPAALGQSYPAKPLRLIVPFSAGGSSDVLARGVAKQLGEQMAEPVVVENRAGAGGMIALEFVAKSAGDGYTLLFGTIGTNGIGPALYKNLNFDPVKDLAPVSSLHTLPNVLLVNAGVPAKTVAELIALAKAQPGKLTFASAGSGSASHLSGVLLKSATGIDILHVPYKGGGTAMPDVLSGQVSMMIETATGALSAIRSGKVRALAVTTAQRWPQLPEVPTMIEAGVPGFEITSWTGLFVPAATPGALVSRLNSELVKAARDPGYVKTMATLGVDAISSTPQEFSAFIESEVAKWGRAIRESGARVE
ncbi:MAG: tripartite tricarboxylate transporter substrate binding protein, partial [Betaproteobacteria bacterium]|nr:tripartite tricarboxylate transporter substrate binding protein [Betaproteobacteria bacterium]